MANLMTLLGVGRSSSVAVGTTLVTSGNKSYNYGVDGGSYVSTLTSSTTLNLVVGDLVAVFLSWTVGSLSVSSVTVGGVACTAGAAALAYVSDKRQRIYYLQVTSANAAAAVTGTLSGTTSSYSVAWEQFRPDTVGTWSVDGLGTATGTYGTSPITTGTFSTTGAGVIVLLAGDFYYDTAGTPNFGADTYLGRTSSGATYNDAWWGCRITTGALTGTTATTALAGSSSEVMGLQAMHFKLT